MRKTYNVTDARITESLELTRRLYRGVTDTAKRLDEQKNQALSIIDVFTPSGEVLRTKLRDYCERLIFKDPIDHARKTEELLWRRGFYDAVFAAKKLRKGNVWNDTEKALLSTHLAVGVGFYHHLILKLQLECNLELVGVIDFAYPLNENGSNSKGKTVQSKLHTEEVRQCAIRLIHRSLVCLGDLARYRLDLDSNWDPMLAVRYYKMAAAIDPNIGMPYNQLGTVAGSRNYGLDAVYHYMRCILCPEPFEGAEGNLKRTITTHSFNGKENCSSHRCIARLLSLLQLWDIDTPNSSRINQDCQDLLNEIENCLTMEKPKSDSKCIDDEDSIEICLQNCKNEQTAHLTDDMIFKIMAICLMSISKLQNRESTEIQGVIAFALTVLSQVIQFTVTKLQESFIDIALSNGEEFLDADLKSMRNDSIRTNEVIDQKKDESNVKNDETILTIYSDCTNVNDNKKNLDNNESIETIKILRNGVKKMRDKPKSLLTKLRRPRRRRNSSDSEASDIDGTILGSSSDELNSDISETEEHVLSEEVVLSDAMSEDLTEDEGTCAKDTTVNTETYDQMNGSAMKEHSENDNKNIVDNNHTMNGKHLITDNETDMKPDEKDSITNSGSSMTITTNVDSSSAYDESSGSTNTVAYVAQLKKQSLDPNDVLNILTEEGKFMCIKICFDWLKNHPNIIQSCTKSTRTFLKRTITLLNLIDVDIDVLVEKWNGDATFLLNSEELKKFTKVLPLPEDIDLRGLKILEGTHKDLDWKILRRCKINKREETLLRILKLIEFGRHLCSIENSGVKYDDVKKLFVMTELKNADILKSNDKEDSKDLESEHPRGKLMRHMGRLWLKAEVRALENRLHSRLMSPYLVPDHEALAKHTPALKRLVYAKKFIVVIPSVVVSALDEVKRISGRAREATRWLEAQLKRGSRFLRAQRPHERLALPLIKGPKPKDKEAWLYFQVIECCHYLTQQAKVGLTGDTETPVVTLLTGRSADDKRTITFSPIGLAKSAGINLEHIESFHTKWKASSKSHG